MRRWPTTLKSKLSRKGATRLESTQVRWLSWQSGREAGPHLRWPKMLKESENDPRKPRDLLKERYSDSLKRLNIFFLRG